MGHAASKQSEPVITTEEALARALKGRRPSVFEDRLVDVLHDDIFRRTENLRMSEQGTLAYERMRHLRRRMNLKVADLFADQDALLALHDWTALVDGTLTTLLTIHYNLCIGSILQHGEGRKELLPYLDELERMESIGTFLATELAYGNNVQALRTEAVYDHGSRSFLLRTPTEAARKFMPNTGAPGIAKIGVVMARLVMGEENQGVFPFLVRLRSENCLWPGVRIVPLGEKPDYALDNAITSFDGVRVPSYAWLAGEGSRIDESGVFSSRIASARRRFLGSMDRVQAGKLCLSFAGLAMLKGGVRAALGYSQKRTTFAPGHAEVPILSYRTYQRAAFEWVSTSYAMAFFLEHVSARYLARTEEDATEVYRLLALAKVFVSSHAARILSECREKVGAQGLFSANRIISYWVHMNGIVTAEGDNEVLLVKTARELVFGDAYSPPEAEKDVRHLPILESADYLVHLFRERERLLHAKILASAASQTERSAFDVWNAHLGDGLRLATVHSVRLVLESFNAALDRVADPTARDVLDRALRLFALERLEGETTALLVDGVIDAALAERMGPERDRLAAELHQHAELLTEAFDLPDALLDAPIANDYFEAYADTEHAPRTSFIRTRTIPPDAEESARRHG